MNKKIMIRNISKRVNEDNVFSTVIFCYKEYKYILGIKFKTPK